MIDGKLELSEITGKLTINKKFVLVDSSKYTQEAFEYILEEVDKFGAVAFISDLKKIYAQGQYYSDLDELKYFTTIAAKNSNGDFTSPSMVAPGPGSMLTFTGRGITYITTNPTDGEIVIETSTEIIDQYIGEVSERLNAIELTYATKDYIADNYQEKLTAGAYINISEDNVITTYNLPSFTYLLDNYATITYATSIQNSVNTLATELHDNYYNREETESVAKDAASEAVAKVIDGADDVFDTLKEISDWIVNSGEYVTVTNSQIAADPTGKYYVKDAEGNYVDAEYDAETGNVVVADGQVTYIYTSTTAADIITGLGELNKEVGDNSSYTYIVDGTTHIFTGDITALTPNGTNEYLYQDPETSDWVAVSYNPSTGIYKVIDDNFAYLNSKIAEITGSVDNLLYHLYADSDSEYTYITLDPEHYDGAPDRTITLHLVEGNFDNTYSSATYGLITQNGLVTAYTVDAMLDYRNGWVLLQGTEID